MSPKLIEHSTCGSCQQRDWPSIMQEVTQIDSTRPGIGACQYKLTKILNAFELPEQVYTRSALHFLQSGCFQFSISTPQSWIYHTVKPL